MNHQGVAGAGETQAGSESLDQAAREEVVSCLPVWGPPKTVGRRTRASAETGADRTTVSTVRARNRASSLCERSSVGLSPTSGVIAHPRAPTELLLQCHQKPALRKPVVALSVPPLVTNAVPMETASGDPFRDWQCKMFTTVVNRSHERQAYEGEDSDSWDNLSRNSDIKKSVTSVAPTPVSMIKPSRHRGQSSLSLTAPAPWQTEALLKNCRISQKTENQKLSEILHSRGNKHRVADLVATGQDSLSVFHPKTVEENNQTNSVEENGPRIEDILGHPVQQWLRHKDFWPTKENRSSHDGSRQPEGKVNGHSIEFELKEKNKIQQDRKVHSFLCSTALSTGIPAASNKKAIEELPSATSVGRVYVMEAASYSNDNYELPAQVDSSSYHNHNSVRKALKKVHSTEDDNGSSMENNIRSTPTSLHTSTSTCLRDAGPFVRTTSSVSKTRKLSEWWLTAVNQTAESTSSRGSSDVYPADPQSKLRRSLTAPHRQQLKRDHAPWSTIGSHAKPSDTDNRRNAIYVDEVSLNRPADDNQSKADESNAQDKDNLMVEQSQPSGKDPPLVPPPLALSTLWQPEPNTRCPPSKITGGLSSQEKEQALKVPNLHNPSLSLTLLAAPRSLSCQAVVTSSPRSDWSPTEATVILSEDRPKSSTITANAESPSTSSRASTVFCPPWDTGSFGMYLADLMDNAPIEPPFLPPPCRENRAPWRRRRRTIAEIERNSMPPIATCKYREMANPEEVQMKVNGNESLHQTPQSEPTNLLRIWDNLREATPMNLKNTTIDEKKVQASSSVRAVTGFRADGRLQKVNDSTESDDICPYAVSSYQPSCPPTTTRSRCFNVSDGARRPSPAPRSKRLLLQNHFFMATSYSNESDQAERPTSSLNGLFDYPKDYIYAQVVPRHLRGHAKATVIPAAIATNGQKELKSSSTSVTEGREVSQLPSVSLSSLSSENYDPPCGNASGADWPHPGGPTSCRLPNKHEPTGGGQVKVGGQIRRFLDEMMSEPGNPVAEQISQFIDCTNNRKDRGPYRTMQSIRQFIAGMTNFLLRNPNLGLPAAVERERQELTGCEFVNVGSLLEQCLQRHILRPLYRQVINELKDVHIRFNEFGELRRKCHLANQTGLQAMTEFGLQMDCNLPTEETVHRVALQFQRMEKTYSPRRKMNHLFKIFKIIKSDLQVNTSRDEGGSYTPASSATLSSTGLHLDLYPADDDADSPSRERQPIHAWIFAKAGLLIAPVDASQESFSPAAVQADYLDCLVSKPQMGRFNSNSTVSGATCLNDLFAMLYWAWCAVPTTRLQPTLDRQSVSQELADATLVSERKVVHENRCIIPSEHRASPALSNPVPRSNGSLRRKFIPLGRRKTITGGPQTVPLLLQYINSINSPRSFLSSSPNCEHPYDLPLPSKELLSGGDSTVPTSRWRPWVPPIFDQTHSKSHCSSVPSTPSIFTKYEGHRQVKQQPIVLRVLVIDEAIGSVKRLHYAIRPNLTAGELCDMIAFKMKIFDPKSFGLYAYLDGREVSLNDNVYLSDFLTETSATLDGLHREVQCESANSAIPCDPEQLAQKALTGCDYAVEEIRHPRWWVTGKIAAPNPSLAGILQRLSVKAGSQDLTAATATKAELIGPVPQSTVNMTFVNAGENDSRQRQLKVSWTPVLIYRRTTGYFAISDNLLFDAEPNVC